MGVQFRTAFSEARFAQGDWRADRPPKSGLRTSGKTVEAALFDPGKRDAAGAGEALEIDLRRLAPIEDGLDDVRSQLGKGEDTAGTGARCAVALGNLGDACDLAGDQLTSPAMGLGHGSEEIGIALWESFLLIMAEQNKPFFSAAALEAGVDLQAVRRRVGLMIGDLRRDRGLCLPPKDRCFEAGGMDLQVSVVR